MYMYMHVQYAIPLTYMYICVQYAIPSTTVRNSMDYIQYVIPWTTVHNSMDYMVVAAENVVTDRRTDGRNDYCNPRCACAPRLIILDEC